MEHPGTWIFIDNSPLHVHIVPKLMLQLLRKPGINTGNLVYIKEVLNNTMAVENVL